MQFHVFLVIAVLLATSVSAGPSCHNPPPDNSGVTIDVIARPKVETDGAHWDGTGCVLYFVDSISGILYRYDPTTPALTSVSIGVGVQTAIQVQGMTNYFAVPVNLTVYLIEWDGQSSSVQSQATLFTLNDRTRNKIEGFEADQNGVLFAGTQDVRILSPTALERYAATLASLYRYKKESDSCSLYTVLTPLQSLDDVAWSPDNTLMYYVDSGYKSVYVADYNLDTADISNIRVFFNVTANGYTDTELHFVTAASVTVDSDGNLWVPIYGLGLLLHISSEAQVIASYTLPTILLNSCAWGDADLSTLYCTSESVALKPSEVASQPEAGSVFAVKGLGSHGVSGSGFPANICRP